MYVAQISSIISLYFCCTLETLPWKWTDSFWEKARVCFLGNTQGSEAMNIIAAVTSTHKHFVDIYTRNLHLTLVIWSIWSVLSLFLVVFCPHVEVVSPPVVALSLFGVVFCQFVFVLCLCHCSFPLPLYCWIKSHCGCFISLCSEYTVCS